MEFWSSLIEEKGLNLPDELDMVKNRSKVLTEEPVAVFDTTGCQFVSSQGLMESGFSDPNGFQSDSSNPSRDVSSDHIGIDQYSEALSKEKRLKSRMVGFFEENDGVNSVLPMKRGRLANLCAQKPICQVQGCGKDLSSLKDYYKRHKVCDAHTKTARVVVKGIEQRFCQQCSRFHLLAEFDDGKRSCRKRLANHNERRRKPPSIRHLNSSVRNSHLLDEMLQNPFPCSTENKSANWFDHVKPGEPCLDSSCALSLLSAQSQKDSDLFIGTSSKQVLAYSSANSEDFGFSGFCSPNKAQPSSSVSSDGVMNNGPNTMNGTMINLLQLSSHLEMVEHKRRIME